MGSLWWPVCEACSGAGAGPRTGTCPRCRGTGRLAPAEWDDPHLPAACFRAERELFVVYGVCGPCGGNGIRLERGDSQSTEICRECGGLGKILEPRRAPLSARFITQAEQAYALEINVRELHARVRAGSLVPTLVAKLNGTTTALVFTRSSAPTPITAPTTITEAPSAVAAGAIA